VEMSIGYKSMMFPSKVCVSSYNRNSLMNQAGAHIVGNWQCRRKEGDTKQSVEKKYSIPLRGAHDDIRV
jgi:hypothetical protein